MNIIWLKRDLRIRDHPALSNGSQNKPFRVIYIFEPDLWKLPDLSYRHYLFLTDCLKSLQNELKHLGIHLAIFIGDAIEIFHQIHSQTPISTIYSCQETWNLWTYKRDKKIRKWVKTNKVSWLEFTQNGVVRGLKSRDGWSSKWASTMKKQPHLPPANQNQTVTLDPIPTPSQLNLKIDLNHQFQLGGTSKAQQLLRSFFKFRGKNYTRSMSSPVTAFDECSRLSAHIAFGAISIRQVFQMAENARVQFNQMPSSPTTTLWKKSTQSFLSRLRWHCHFIQKLEDDPLIELRSLHSMYRPFDQKDYREDFFRRWCDGQTGYPMIDACMRCLKHTGWLNFRMRAMVMSFGAHHLQLPWRICALYLATQFTDYEPGIHYSQCQMQSGVTGINTIRIYNPIKQSYDQDLAGTFIRQWCPELCRVPKSGIHEPWHYGEAPPIVDEDQARRAAGEILYQIRKSPAFNYEADLIQHKHGSRRKQTTHNTSNPLPLFKEHK